MNTYVFDSSTKKNIFISFGIGLVFFILGVLFFGNGNTDNSHAHGHATNIEAQSHAENGGHHGEAPTVKTAIVANVYNIFYFGFYIALASLFILSATNIAWGGWQIQIQKIPLAMGATIGVFLVCLLAMFLLFRHDIFHWTHEELYIVGSKTFDEVLNTKSDFLNMKTFWTFYVLIAGSCIFIAYKYVWSSSETISSK